MQVAAATPHVGPGNGPNIRMMFIHCCKVYTQLSLSLSSPCQPPNRLFFPVSSKNFAFACPGGNHGKAVKITHFFGSLAELKKNKNHSTVTPNWNCPGSSQQYIYKYIKDIYLWSNNSLIQSETNSWGMSFFPSIPCPETHFFSQEEMIYSSMLQ